MLAFNDRMGLRSLSTKDHCTQLEVVGDGVLSPKSYDARAVKAWVHIPSTHPGLREVAIKEAACAVLMQISGETLNDMDCIMLHQMIVRVVEEARNGIQEQHDAEHQQQFEDWLEKVVLCEEGRTTCGSKMECSSSGGSTPSAKESSQELGKKSSVQQRGAFNENSAQRQD